MINKEISYVAIDSIIFNNKQNIPWNEVEKYLKRYIGGKYKIKGYDDIIIVPGDFPDEYSESKYTKKLRGAVAKAKANAVQRIPEIIENAVNRRWVKNKNPKHNKYKKRSEYAALVRKPYG